MKAVDSQGRLKATPGAAGLTLVIKVGTSSLVRAEQNTLNLSNLARICETVRVLQAAGHRVVVVSSGAVGVGCQRLGLGQRPAGLAQRQALAAVGQVHLMRYYADFFSALHIPCAQVLLTLDNLAARGQYLNARSTFTELFALGSVPIVNENDTVAVEELRFGDNDTLSAQVATLVRADWLFLMTDVDCLYTADPGSDPTAQPIHEVHDIAKLQVDTSRKGTRWGTGGMATKLTAARLATAAGCRMVICSAAQPEAIPAILAGERIGTIFHPLPTVLRGRRRWILSVPVKGELRLDSGAVRAVRDRRKSLFSAGILAASGDFAVQDAVRLCTAEGEEFARGLANYSCAEVDQIKGLSSNLLAERLGYQGSEEIVHRDNLCLLAHPAAEASNSDEDDTAAASPARPNGTSPAAAASDLLGAGLQQQAVQRSQAGPSERAGDAAGTAPQPAGVSVTTVVADAVLPAGGRSAQQQAAAHHTAQVAAAVSAVHLQINSKSSQQLINAGERNARGTALADGIIERLALSRRREASSRQDDSAAAGGGGGGDEDVTLRLRIIRQRQLANTRDADHSYGSHSSDGTPLEGVNWRQELLQAMQAEREEEQEGVPGSLREHASRNLSSNLGSEDGSDVDERGWKPS